MELKLEYIKLGGRPQKDPIPLRHGERKLIEGRVRPTPRKVKRLMYHQNKPWREFEKTGIVDMIRKVQHCERAWYDFGLFLCIHMGGMKNKRLSLRAKRHTRGWQLGTMNIETGEFTPVQC